MIDFHQLVDSPVAERLDRLRSSLVLNEADAMLVTNRVNVRWLTGFTGSNATLALTNTEAVLITDGRYRTQAADQLDVSGAEVSVEITRQPAEQVVDSVFGPRQRVAVEATDITLAQYRALESELVDRALVPTENVVLKLRQIKDEGELSRLRLAAAIADDALAEVIPMMADRPTEREVALSLDNAMIARGADEPSYATIVGSGPNAALPHATPTSRVIGTGDIVIIDVGARVEGYGSDMTRTFVVGEPSGEQQRWYDAVVESQAAGVNAVAAGVEQRLIDDTTRSVLKSHGLEEAFIHGTGHGIGLEIHEDPILSPRSEGILRAGMVVTVEPGVYLAGQGGVRVEDSVVVTSTGCEPITHIRKSLAI